MPDRRASRTVAALSGALLAVLLAGPVALAQSPSEELGPDQQPTPEQPAPDQPDQPGQPGEPEQHPPGTWGASSFEDPFDQEDGVTLRRDTFDVLGTLRYQKTGPSDFIRQTEVRILDDPSDDFTLGGDCTLPEPSTFTGAGPQPGLTAEQIFEVVDVTLPCNGRYLVEAQGWLEDPDAGTFTLRRSFVVAAMPASVSGLGATLDGAERAVTATFQPIPESDLAPDAIGYVLERSGPEDATFVDVDTIGLDDPPRFVDPLDGAPAGAYTYRVRAVRAGADGEVRSSVIDTETDTLDVEGEPASTTSTRPRTTTRRSTSVGSRSTGGRPTTGRTRPGFTTITTLDTGFGDVLDYGDGGPGDPGELDADGGDEPLAGQSVVRDEGEGMGLAVPAAGALVMLGWAGHLLYLNRLAKQL